MSRIPRRPIALVTCDRIPGLTADDRRLGEALCQLGLAARPAVWSNPTLDWSGFDAVVFRSCWDYHQRFTEFESWLDVLAASGAAAWNPLQLVRWNAAKSYLRTLAAAGVAVVPTTILDRREDWSIDALRDAAGSADIVVKPLVSATAWLTWRFDAAASEMPAACLDALRTRDCLVQPFVPEIVNGEWSLVFFDRVFSHAVVKRPRPDDFRVQEEYGGTATAQDPPAALLQAARRALEAVPGPVLYARVDGVDTATGFQLLELELFEPALYLSVEPAAAGRFAAALERAVTGVGPRSTPTDLTRSSLP